MAKDLYESLGVGRDADPATIRKAHRQKVSKVHPDKPGGSHQEFLAVQKAYEVLSDINRRKRYDETGDAEVRPGNIQQELISILLQCAGKVDIAHTSLVAEAGKVIRSSLEQARIANQATKDAADRFRNVATRLKSKDGTPDNPFSRAMVLQAESLEAAIAKTEARMADGEEMLKLLDGLDYKTDGPFACDEALASFMTRAKFRY